MEISKTSLHGSANNSTVTCVMTHLGRENMLLANALQSTVHVLVLHTAYAREMVAYSTGKPD